MHNYHKHTSKAQAHFPIMVSLQTRFSSPYLIYPITNPHTVYVYVCVCVCVCVHVLHPARRYSRKTRIRFRWSGFKSQFYHSLFNPGKAPNVFSLRTVLCNTGKTTAWTLLTSDTASQDNKSEPCGC